MARRRAQQEVLPRLERPLLSLPLLTLFLLTLAPLGLATAAKAQTAAVQPQRSAHPERQALEPSCPRALAIEPLPPPPGGSALLPPPAPNLQGQDYRHRLRPTAYGWTVRQHWCIWIEPAQQQGPAGRWEQAWLEALEQALTSWSELMPITRVSEPERAQLLILRRRPPLRGGRASHGRAELSLVRVRRGGTAAGGTNPHAVQGWQLEPRVQLSLSPGQRPMAMQATALHELGHAFGMWGHSDAAGDAMAAVPGAVPVLELSARDRATLRWLQQQPGLQPALAAPPDPGPIRPTAASSPGN